MFNLQRICATRKYLTRSASSKPVCGITSHVSPRLHQCTTRRTPQMQHGSTTTNTKHSSKNSTRQGYDSSTRCLAELHWLPIQQRIEFKIITLAHKLLHGLAPYYLVDLLTRKVPRREGLQSNNRTSQLLVPKKLGKCLLLQCTRTTTLEPTSRSSPTNRPRCSSCLVNYAVLV